MIEAKLRKIWKLSERFLEIQNANYQLPEDGRWKLALHERLLKGIIIFRFFAGLYLYMKECGIPFFD